MADKLGLDYDEVVILQETSVAHGGLMSLYTDELILTNKKIICLSKGMFGGTKKTYHYPLDQIKVFNGIPQVQQGKQSNGSPTLDVYLRDGEEHFGFQSSGKKKIATWIEEIQKLFGVAPVATRNSSGSDDSVLGAFKEVGENFKDIGRDLAESFGFKFKSKKNTGSVNTVIPVQTNSYIPVQVNAPQTGTICPSCGKPLPSGSRFCTSCGAQIGAATAPSSPVRELQERVCPTCGKKLPADLRFCTECGTEIKPLNDAGANSQEKAQETVPKKEKLTIDQQIELLQKLKSLVDAGVISQEEFEKKKKEIL